MAAMTLSNCVATSAEIRYCCGDMRPLVGAIMHVAVVFLARDGQFVGLGLVGIIIAVAHVVPFE